VNDTQDWGMIAGHAAVFLCPHVILEEEKENLVDHKINKLTRLENFRVFLRFFAGI
jgi:hypothetical protein